MVIVAHRAGVLSLPPAVAHRQHFREKHMTCPFAHCAAITLSEQSAASACLAAQSGSDAAFGGWDDEPAATFDSAGAIVAIGYSRDRGCRLARCLRAYRNPEHRRGATQGHQRSLSLHRTGTRRGTAAKLDAQ